MRYLFYVILILFLIFVLSFSYADPNVSKLPPSVGSESNTNNFFRSNSNSPPIKENNLSSGETKSDTPEIVDVQIKKNEKVSNLPEDKTSETKNLPMYNKKLDSDKQEPTFNFWKLSTITLLTIALFQILVIFLLLKKNSNSKENNMLYENQRDSIEYNVIHDKIKNYILTYKDSYSYSAIKTSLVQQGFKAEEIDEIRMEIQDPNFR